ncbi:MAG: uroporphyrinogen-III synthase [Bacteroidales bacterium]|nr:uroporphyrinogen-III synthase [Bacteroidales bacterium]
MKIKNVLVSQPKPAEVEKSPYYLLAKKYKVNIDFHKFIKVEGIKAIDFRKDRVVILDHSAVIFTSRLAVDHFFRLSKEMRAEIPDSMKYFCVSETIAFYLQKYVQYRKRKIFYGRQSFNQLMEIIVKHKGENFLLPCSDVAEVDLTKILKANKINHSKAIMYQTVASDLSEVEIDKYDLLVLFSPSGVKSLFANFPEYKQGETLIGAFGPSTCKAVEEAGLKLSIEAPTKSAPSMTMALEQYIENLMKRK